MSIQEKFAGFNYQDHQKYHQEAVEKYGQEVMDQALERQKQLFKNCSRIVQELFKNCSGIIEESSFPVYLPLATSSFNS